MCVRVGGLSVGGGDSGGDAGGDEDSKGAVWFAREQAAKEAAICQGAMAKRKSNYHAARHFAQACIGRLRSIRSPAGAEHLGAAGAAGASVSASALARLREQLASTRTAAVRNPSDASIFHARRAVLMAVISQSGAAMKDAIADQPDRSSVLADERGWVEDQLRRAPWHEVLWQHKRWLMHLRVRACLRRQRAC